MPAYLKQLEIDGVEEVGEETTNSAYLKIVEIVEVVDQNGDPWEPVPGPDPWDDLAIINNGGANWIGSNVYEIGETITGRTAEFTGGQPPVTYRARFQTRSSEDQSWVNSAWVTVPNEKTDVTYDIQAPGQIRLQSQARDSQDPQDVVTSNTGVKTAPYLEFGTISVTVNDIEYDYNTAPPLTILMNDPLPAVVSITGNASPTYTWSARNEYPIMVGSQTASTVLTFPQEGAVTVTCTLNDPNTEEVNTSVVINFFVVDAFD